MDFGDPWKLISALVIGLIGFMVLNHGRKEGEVKVLATGLLLCIYPYFVASLLMLWLVFAVIVGGAVAISKWS
ncbi:MAG: hypothetical protein H7210_14305 [Pyrinomonadaceae bacterium]|nr:hypothetical protein [Phycisphaerales bacterium]